MAHPPVPCWRGLESRFARFMSRTPRIAAVGLASWDTLLAVDSYPSPGSYAIVDRQASLPGGTTTNSAVALARIGAQVSFVGLVGDDLPGETIRETLDRESVNTSWLETRVGQPTDAAIVVVSNNPSDRTIFWPQGARIAKGDLLDIPAIFGHDLVLLDVDNMPLRRFLSDLPAHTLPGTHILGTLTYLDPTETDRLDVMLRHDAIVGNEREVMLLTEEATLDAAIAKLQERMIGSNLRAAVISRGAMGGSAFTATERWDLPANQIDVVDTTGAGDAFTAGVAFGMSLRWPWLKTLTLANAIGGLATRALGAQESLPSLQEIASLTGESAAYWSP
jgi:sugar/nucleoside kinase (ribokinase family)